MRSDRVSRGRALLPEGTDVTSEAAVGLRLPGTTTGVMESAAARFVRAWADQRGAGQRKDGESMDALAVLDPRQRDLSG